MTSKDIENYTKKITSTRSLTGDEQKELKWQKRLVKNRESAQASRSRKKSKIDELEGVINQMNKEQQTYNAEITQLEASNKSLKEEVVHLHNLIKQSPALSNLWNNIDAIKRKTIDKDPKKGHNNIKAAGMVLLIVLFSFNLFFNSGGVQANTSQNTYPLYQGLRDFIANDIAATQRNNLSITNNNNNTAATSGLNITESSITTPPPAQEESISPSLLHSGTNVEQQMQINTESPLLLLVSPAALATLLMNRVIANNSIVLDIFNNYQAFPSAQS